MSPARLSRRSVTGSPPASWVPVALGLEGGDGGLKDHRLGKFQIEFSISTLAVRRPKRGQNEDRGSQ
jgi:hypothetical protein